MENIMLTQYDHAQAFNLHPIRRKNIPPGEKSRLLTSRLVRGANWWEKSLQSKNAPLKRGAVCCTRNGKTMQNGGYLSF